MTHPELIDRLTALLGRTWRHRDQCWRVIDLLPEAGLLVLESAEGQPVIHLDQFGRASHRAPDMHQIPMFEPGGTGLSEELEELLRGLGPASET